MKLFRKMTALLLSVLITLSVLYVLPANTFITAAAAEVEDESDTAYNSGDFSYEILDYESVKINSYTGCNEEAVIPDMIGNYKVTVLGEVFRANRFVKTVTIGQYVRTIDSPSFCSFTAVEQFEVSEQNPYLKSVDGVIFSKDGKTLVRTPAKLSGSYTVPAGVETIGDYAMADSREVESITFGNDVKVIGNSACKYISALKSVSFGSKLEEIGENAFESCYDLASLTFPNSLKTIGKEAFRNCNGPETLVLPDSLKTIGDYAFADLNDLKYIEIGSGLETLGEGAFKYCDALASFSVSASNANFKAVDGVLLSKDGKSLIAVPCAISGSFTVPDGVTEIPDNAFYQCDDLTSIKLADSVTTVGIDAFSCCDKLTKVDLGDGVTSVGAGAFYSDPELKELRFGKAFSEFSADMFITNSGYGGYYEPTNVETIVFSDDNPYYKTVDGVVYSKDGTKIVMIPSGFSGDFTVPDGVTTLESGAFDNCPGVTGLIINHNLSIAENCFVNTYIYKLVFGNNVTEIPVGAFSGMHLFELVIGDGITEIPDYAFQDAFYKHVSFIDDGPSVASSGQKAGETVGASLDWTVNEQEPPISLTIGKNVERIGAHAFENNSFDSITFNNKLKTIGDYAFYGYDGKSYSLETLSFPNSLKTIGAYAFENFNDLTEIVLPNGMESVGDYAFANCSSVQTIRLGGTLTVGESAFFSCDETKTLDLGSRLKSVGDSAFFGLLNVTALRLPDSLETIGYSAFADLSALEQLTFGSGLKTIGDNAFQDDSYNEDHLTELRIPDSVLSIGDNAFAYRSALESVVIGSNTETIGNRAFFNCPNIESIDFGKKLKSLGVKAFANEESWNMLLAPNASLTELVFPDTLETIGEDAFANCIAIESVDLGKSLQGIPSRLFKNLKSLKEITFPDTLKTIGDSAFSGCTALETLKLPVSVTDIDNFAFQGCTALSEVDLGNVVSIGWYAFEGCTGITSLKLPDSVNSLGKYALRGMTNLTELKVGKNLTEGLDQSLIEGNVSLKKIIIDEENSVYKSYCGTVLTKDGRTLLLVPKRFTGEYILPETVTSITGSFQGCTGLTSFTFIGRVTTVPENMFSGCNQLHSVILSPETVYINERAFYGCSKLEAIELGDKIRNIGIEAFRGCSKLTEVMIPKSVQSIGDSAFVSCSQLNRVVLSGTYTKLSPNAFYGLSGLNIYCYRNTTTHNSVTELSNASMIKVLYLSDEFYPVDPAITDLTSKSVTFEWKKPKGVSQTVRYNVYRDGVKVASYLTDNSFSQSGLTAGTKYNYEISAIDIAGLESSVRTSITVVPACTTVKAITAPKKDTEIGGTVPVTLTAEMNDTLSSKDAKGEFFYSRDGKDFTSIGEAEMDADMKVFSAKWDLTELVTDTYIIRFVFTDKDGGTSLMDSSVKVDRTPPQKIFGVTTRGRETSISVTWGVAAEADTNKYRIYRKTEDETKYSVLCDIDGRFNLSYNDSEVENNVVYFYYVVGVDKYGQESAEFDQVPAALIDDIIAPQITKIAPSMNSFVYGDYPVTITAVDNVGVTKIELYCSEDEKNWTLLDSVSGSVFSKPIDTTAMKQGTVYIKATAYDVAGNKSEDSLTYVWSVDNQGPEKIKNVQCINSLSTIVTLSWDQPADDDISYFAVERKDEDGYTEVARSYHALGANLEKLTPDTEYTYRVLAYDRFGNRGAVSDEITVNTEKDTTAPRVTNIAPGANYYNGELELALTVTDDSKVASVKIQVSYDKKNWNTLAAINADTPDQTVVFKHTLNLDDYREGSIFVRGIAKDTAGNEMTDEMASTCEYIVDRTKPSCPEEIKIDSDERMIHVVWSPSTSKDADHYIISRCEEEDGEYEVINKNVKSIDYYDTNVDQFKTYFYKLQTVDYAGNVSRRSDPLSCQVLRDIEDPKLAGFIPEDGETVGMINNKVVACFTDNTMLDNAVVLYSRESSPDDFEILVEKEKIKSGHCTLEKKLPIEDFDDGEKITLFFAAMDTTGNVFESDKAVYTIDKTAPAVENFNITVGEYNFFTLEWEFDEEPHIVDLFRKGDTDNDFVLIREFNNSIEENKDSGVYVDGEVSTSNRSVCYKLVTYDENGNSEEYISEEVPVTSEVPPQAVINSPATVEVGVSNLYSGLLSTDDREIVSYHFDFGDGTQLDDANCYHTYSETGSYRLVLTVTDSDGLTSSTSKMIHVNERSLQGKVKVKVVDGNRRAIANASVYMDYNDSDKKQVLKTDEKGEVEFSADIDAHSFAAYKEDYLPQLREGYQINNGYNEPITFELEKSPIVKGEFTIKRMTYNEIVSAGINVNDPKNQNVVKVNTTLYYAGVPKYAEFIWDGVKIRGGEITVTHCGVSRKLVPKVFRGGGPMKIGDGDGEDIIPNVAYIDIPVDITVLKEFFDVKLHIINNANKNGFSLTGNTVTLDLPAGLSVVNEVSRDYIQPGNINDGNYLFTKAQGYIPVINNSATITWIVRGDTPGAYKIGADYTANISKINERMSS